MILETLQPEKTVGGLFDRSPAYGMGRALRNEETSLCQQVRCSVQPRSQETKVNFQLTGETVTSPASIARGSYSKRFSRSSYTSPSCILQMSVTTNPGSKIFAPADT